MLENVSAQYSLRTNYMKTKVVMVDRENNNRLNIQHTGQCQVTNKFLYLGIIVNKSGDCEDEI